MIQPLIGNREKKVENTKTHWIVKKFELFGKYYCCILHKFHLFSSFNDKTWDFFCLFPFFFQKKNIVFILRLSVLSSHRRHDLQALFSAFFFLFLFSFRHHKLKRKTDVYKLFVLCFMEMEMFISNLSSLNDIQKEIFTSVGS
jgi:hypothetical protein